MNKSPLSTALSLCVNFHDGQMRREGVIPYAMHPIEVSQSLESEDDKCIALMHDLLEDTSCSLEHLETYGFNDYIIKGVVNLTRLDGVKYFDYIKSIEPQYRHIKIADIMHNYKTATLSEKRRYNEALRLLELKRKIY